MAYIKFDYILKKYNQYSIIIPILLVAVFTILYIVIIDIYNKEYIIHNIQNLPSLELSLSKNKDILRATFTDDQTVQTLYQMLKDTTELLNHANITYSIYSGTLLGAIRHQGLIPWDYDIDLVIFYKDRAKLIELKSLFSTYGYKLFNNTFMYKIGKVNKIGRLQKNGLLSPCIDIFLIHENQNSHKLIYSDPILQKTYPNEWLLKNNFFPLKLYYFGPLQVYGPNDPELFLDNAYGSSWRTVAVIHPKHLFAKYKKKFIIQLNDQLKQPSLPKKPLLDRVKFNYENN